MAVVDGKLSRFLPYALVFAVAFALFANTLNHEYAWDDRIVITENPYVQNGVQGLTEIWVKQHSDFLFDQIGYRPITLSTFAIEQEFWPNNPEVGHFINVFLYAVLSTLVLWFLLKVLGLDVGLALLISLVFIAHPLHSEVVANIKSRDEILQMLFGLLSVIFFKKWLEKRTWTGLIPVLSFLMLGILSKENAIAFVGVMAVVWTLDQSGFKWNRQNGVVLSSLLFLGAIAVALIAFGLTGTVGIEKTEGLGIFYESPILNDCFRQVSDPVQLLLNKNLLIYRYLVNFIWPMNLVYTSGFDQITMFDSLSAFTILGAVATILLFGLVIWSYRRSRNIYAGLGFFLILISPFLHLVRPMPDTMADRFVFAGSLGLAIALVSGTEWVLSALKNTETIRTRVLPAVVLVFVCFLAVGTFERNRVWKDDLTLFGSDLPKLENCAKAHEHYADALHVKLTKTGDRSLIPEIVKHYERSIGISELSYYSFIKLGSNYSQWGSAENGIKLLERAVELYPEQADPHFYLGNAYFQSGRFKAAIPLFKKSIALSPRVSDSYYLLALSFYETGQVDSAEFSARVGMRKFPEDELFRDVLVDVEMRRGNLKTAFAQLDTILEMKPTSTVFWKKAIGLRQSVQMNAQADSLYRLALSKGIVFSN